MTRHIFYVVHQGSLGLLAILVLGVKYEEFTLYNLENEYTFWITNNKPTMPRKKSSKHCTRRSVLLVWFYLIFDLDTGSKFG